MGRGAAVNPSFDAATPADVPVLMTLIGELAEFERLAHELVVTEAALREALFGPAPAVETIIARVGGEVAGFALYFHSFSTFLGRRGLYLEDLYVRPAFRGQGVGRGLLEHVARLATARGCGRMEWAVLNWNRRAVRFYEALGARPVNDWTVYRLDRAALDALEARASGT
jgi:GNAT superfamily N-acetyltransferase